jgi:hypothetical protein
MTSHSELLMKRPVTGQNALYAYFDDGPFRG